MSKKAAAEKADAGETAGGKAAPKKKGMGVFGVMLTVVLVMALLAAGAVGGGYYWMTQEFAKPGPAAEDAIVLLPPGSGLIAIASKLESDGLITNRHVFRAGVTLAGGERSLKAGEYAIPAGASMEAIYEELAEGRVIEHAITLAEGLTSAAIVRRLDEEGVLSGEVDAAPAEGALLPETYQVVRGTARAALLERMADAQTTLVDELWPNRADNLPFESKEEAIILASIVEKETGVAEERGQVAAVFVNRLRRGMRLESDPTIIYGISGGEPLVNAAGERRGLRRSELDNASNPFNTYQIAGLPPTPICNPGADAIRAVLNPDPSNALFFVADGTGGHAFAATLAEHNRNVARWRRIERERNGGG